MIKKRPALSRLAQVSPLSALAYDWGVLAMVTIHSQRTGIIAALTVAGNIPTICLGIGNLTSVCVNTSIPTFKSLPYSIR